MSIKHPSNIKKIVITMFICIVWHKVSNYEHPTYKNITEIINTHEYITEEHEVTTDDGYMLTVFRINKRTKCKIKSIPVFLMHGLFESSDMFIDAGPDAGLVYLFADACYDLWVGNTRGNYYSRKHKSLDPDKDKMFWNFSADEISLYDLPAKIDYILNYTKSSEVHYVGFSQAGSTPLLMCSLKPEYCEKIGVIISIAPATKLTNSRSILFRHIMQITNTLENVFYMFRVYELMPRCGILQTIINYACNCEINTLNRYICQTVISLFDSHNPGSITDDTLKMMFKHFPAGSSVKNLARYGQISETGKIKKYDFGELNFKMYGSVNPPEYNLKIIKTPVLILQGRNDYLIDLKDSESIANDLSNAELYVVEDPMWNHFDMIYSQHINSTIFQKIHDFLSKYNQELCIL